MLSWRAFDRFAAGELAARPYLLHGGVVELDTYLRSRPFAYHLTARANLARVRANRRLESTRRLMRAGGVSDLASRRLESVELEVGADRVVVRDQRPLVAGNVAFDPGWDLARLVEHLNGFVYFWPGTAEGPVRCGRNHHARYAEAGEELAILRIPTQSLLSNNASPFFSSCNSGAPRMSGGKRCRRGGETFLPASAFTLPPGRVVELVFRDLAELPPETAWAPSLSSRWASLWS